MPGRYRHDWLLFVDWCTATDRAALPTEPGHRDRVPRRPPRHPRHEPPAPTAIRWTHQHARELAPHRTAELRSRVLPPTDRTRSTPRPSGPCWSRCRPAGGPPASSGAATRCCSSSPPHGVPYAAMERLHRRDVTVDENRCLVVTLPNSVVRIPAAPADPRTCPVAVYLRWARLLAYYDRYPSATRSAKALRAAQPTGESSLESYQPLPRPRRVGKEPLIPSIDRWGQFGSRFCISATRGIAAESVATLIASYTTGSKAFRSIDRPIIEVSNIVRTDGAEAARVDGTSSSDVQHDVREEWQARLNRRRSDIENLADLEQRFQEIEERAAALCSRIDALLILPCERNVRQL